VDNGAPRYLYRKNTEGNNVTPHVMAFLIIFIKVLIKNQIHQ
jgi:hypothetical protein